MTSYVNAAQEDVQPLSRRQRAKLRKRELEQSKITFVEAKVIKGGLRYFLVECEGKEIYLPAKVLRRAKIQNVRVGMKVEVHYIQHDKGLRADHARPLTE